MKINKALLITTAVFIVLLGLGLGAGYLYFSKRVPVERPPAVGTPQVPKEDSIYMKLYYPLPEGLGMEERKVAQGIPPDEAVIREFLKGPAGKSSYVPHGATLLGTYLAEDGILYINLSSEFRGNFSGDAMAEFLLLRGLYESVMGNVQGIKDVMLLIEGKEVETLGGHLTLLSALGESVSGR